MRRYIYILFMLRYQEMIRLPGEFRFVKTGNKRSFIFHGGEKKNKRNGVGLRRAARYIFFFFFCYEIGDQVDRNEGKHWAKNRERERENQIKGAVRVEGIGRVGG